MNLLKPSILFCFFFSIAFTSCVTKRTTTNANGSVVDEGYVVKRPVKKFIKTVEFE